MLQRVLIALAVLVIAVFAFVGYTTFSLHHADSAADPGSRPRTEQPSTPFPTSTAPVADPAAPDDNQQQLTSGGAALANGAAPPASDSIAPDPANGEKFGGGSGHYQLYRQGDLTWRLNTDTGETCILFATDEQWRKPKVYRAGCRGRS